jgi:hypothetical protein
MFGYYTNASLNFVKSGMDSVGRVYPYQPGLMGFIACASPQSVVAVSPSCSRREQSDSGDFRQTGHLTLELYLLGTTAPRAGLFLIPHN